MLKPVSHRVDAIAKAKTFQFKIKDIFQKRNENNSATHLIKIYQNKFIKLQRTKQANSDFSWSSFTKYIHKCV